MEMGKSPFGQFHVVVRGNFLVELEHGKSLELNAGDLIFFPVGSPHALVHSRGGPKKNGMEFYNAHMNGEAIFSEGSENVTLVCGHFEYDWNFKYPFLNNLPKLILLKKEELEWSKSLEFILSQISHEIH
jgi:hypothetical protein